MPGLSLSFLCCCEDCLNVEIVPGGLLLPNTPNFVNNVISSHKSHSPSNSSGVQMTGHSKPCCPQIFVTSFVIAALARCKKVGGQIFTGCCPNQPFALRPPFILSLSKENGGSGQACRSMKSIWATTRVFLTFEKSDKARKVHHLSDVFGLSGISLIPYILWNSGSICSNVL